MSGVENKIALADIIEAAAQGVLRALDARHVGRQKTETRDLVSAGFRVDLIIRCGGIPGDGGNPSTVDRAE